MIKKRILAWLGAILVISILFVGCVTPITKEITEPQKEREYLVEQIYDLVVYRVYGDGFEELSVKDQLLAYWLTQAAIAGRDIFYQQMHHKDLDIRRVLDSILSASEGINEELIQKIKHYAYRFWDSSSNYDQRTFKKFLPKFTYKELGRAAQKAYDNGADFGLKEGETLDGLLEGVKDAMFNPNSDPYLKNQEAEDIVKKSAINFYEGVTQDEVEKLYDSGRGKNPLNSRVVKRWGRLNEQVYKVEGLYSDEIEQIIFYLEKAKPYCSKDQAECMDLLIKYYKSGDLADFERFNIAWVQTNPEVDFINGFIEVYQDPLGMKGSWEGLVNFVNKEKTEAVKKIIDEAQYFENSMPWKSDYKKVWKEKSVAKSVSVLGEIGDAATCCVIGINLPNSQKIREEYGSKSIALDNVVEALNRGREEAYGAQVLEEFALPDEWEADSKWVTQADWVELNFHEIIGHGSGKANESLAEDPSFYIKEYYNTLEETRAELLPFISCQMTKQSNLACYQAKMRHGHTTEIMLGVIYNS
jgi:dipeptidyl-peptidase-3